MKSVKKVIDINAHIENLKCQIESSAGGSLALISFDNLGFGTVTAIKFNAIGYNSFGDVIKINGNDRFFLIIQDISIGKNERAENLKAKLPDGDVRKLVLEECQICYADGSVATYAGKDEREFEQEAFENIGDESIYLRALKDKLGDEFKYKPANYSEGWVCSCGRFNKKDVGICSCCKNLKTDLIAVTSEDNKAKLITDYEKKEEEQATAAKALAIKNERERKKKNILIALGSIATIAILVLIIRASILVGRSTFSSEAEMKAAVKGTYTCYEAYESEYQLKFDGDTYTKRWIILGSDSDLESEVYEWNYRNGTMKIVGGTAVVKSNGDIKYDGDLYEKGGYWSETLSEKSYASLYETERTALKILNVSVTSNSSYTICTGTVTNNGEKSYDFVEVKGSFKDSSGTVLDTDWTYAVGSEGLDPGESTIFRLSVQKNSKITDCSVSFMD